MFLVGLGVNQGGSPTNFALLDSFPTITKYFYGVGVKKLDENQLMPGPEGLMVRHVELHAKVTDCKKFRHVSKRCKSKL